MQRSSSIVGWQLSIAVCIQALQSEHIYIYVYENTKGAVYIYMEVNLRLCSVNDVVDIFVMQLAARHMCRGCFLNTDKNSIC